MDQKFIYAHNFVKKYIQSCGFRKLELIGKKNSGIDEIELFLNKCDISYHNSNTNNDTQDTYSLIFSDKINIDFETSSFEDILKKLPTIKNYLNNNSQYPNLRYINFCLWQNENEKTAKNIPLKNILSYAKENNLTLNPAIFNVYESNLIGSFYDGFLFLSFEINNASKSFNDINLETTQKYSNCNKFIRDNSKVLIISNDNNVDEDYYGAKILLDSTNLAQISIVKNDKDYKPTDDIYRSSFFKNSKNQFETIISLQDIDNFKNIKNYLKLLSPSGRLIFSNKAWKEEISKKYKLNFESNILLEDNQNLFIYYKSPFNQNSENQEPYNQHLFPVAKKNQNLNLINFSKHYQYPYLIQALVNVNSRLQDKKSLENLTHVTLKKTKANTADFGAALCVLAYIKISQNTPQEIENIHKQISDYIKENKETKNPHIHRWIISLSYVNAILYSAQNDYSNSMIWHDKTSNYNFEKFSPLIGTKIVDSCYKLGIYNYSHNNFDNSKKYWKKAINIAEKACQTPWKSITGELDSPLDFSLKELNIIIQIASKCLSGLSCLKNGPHRSQLSYWHLLNDKFELNTSQIYQNQEFKVLNNQNKNLFIKNINLQRAKFWHQTHASIIASWLENIINSKAN